jgi:molecular chaperone HtpG
MERAAAAKGESANLIGQFGVGFYSCFMVAERVEVFSRRAGAGEASVWSSEGKGAYTVAAADPASAPSRGTRVVLHLKDDALAYAERATLERIVRAQSGHVPVPIVIVEGEGEPMEIADGAALWAKAKGDITAADYTDFYRTLAFQFDDPALTVHYRAEGRHEYTVLAFVPGARPFDLFDPVRRGRMKLYVRRVFITDDADLLPRWLRFVTGLVDSNDLPLNVSREMIQESPVLAAIRKGVTGRILAELEKLAGQDAEAYVKVWENFGAVLKEGLYEDRDRRDQLLKLARFRTTASGDGWRSLAEYAAAMRPNQTAVYYIAGSDVARLAVSPQLEGFRARGVEVLLLPDPVDSFWVTAGLDVDGKPLRSVTQGQADLAAVPLLEQASAPAAEAPEDVRRLMAGLKAALGERVEDVRASARLTESPVCLVAPENAMDRELERILSRAGQLSATSRPVLEVNPRHPLIEALARIAAPEPTLREDMAHLLLDEARILDGEPPEDPRAFADRLTRLMQRGLPPA